jgi:hypothetical protein
VNFDIPEQDLRHGGKLAYIMQNQEVKERIQISGEHESGSCKKCLTGVKAF